MSDAVDVLSGVIAARDAEIERLRDELANMYRLHRERGALMDDLAAALGRVVGTAYIPEDVIVVLARYRENERPVKYLVGYIISGEVVIEAESKEAAKDALRPRLPSLVKGEAVMITATEMPEELADDG